MSQTFQELINLVLAAGKKFPNKWDLKTHYIDLVEEVGELGNAVLIKTGSKSVKRERAQLDDSFADVLFELIQMADAAGISLERALTQMLTELEERQKAGEYQNWMKHQKLKKLVEQAYLASSLDFSHWMWTNHVPLVADKALDLAQKHSADVDIAVAGALLHDFGDAFVHRFDSAHDMVSQKESSRLMKQAGYADKQIVVVLTDVIPPHSCHDDNLPQTLEAKILATADAWAHLSSDFYLQFAWKHLPEGKTFPEFVTWAREKIERDYRRKIYFEEVRVELADRYHALTKIFS